MDDIKYDRVPECIDGKMTGRMLCLNENGDEVIPDVASRVEGMVVDGPVLFTQDEVTPMLLENRQLRNERDDLLVKVALLEQQVLELTPVDVKLDVAVDPAAPEVASPLEG
jgi:hypothetical protein